MFEASYEVPVPQIISRTLTQFGYDLFGAPSSTFAPVTDVPVGPDYILGPGDSMTIHVWGLLESVLTATVDRNGNVFLPRAGVIHLAGLPFSEAEVKVKDALTKFFRKFELKMTMQDLHTIKVFVVGEVVKPGGYTISSLSTISNALYVAGGPSKRGSMRTIKLIRNNDTLTTLDLYEFLLKGNKVHDLRLESGDTIFVPPIGPVAAISGMVKRPAIYELSGPTRVSQLIEMAAGLVPTSYLRRIQIERVQEHQKKVLRDLDLSSLYAAKDSKADIEIRDGDFVKVFPIDSTIYERVRLGGAVKFPGDYEFKPGMKISSLITQEMLLPQAYLEKAELVRLNPDLTYEVHYFNVRNLLKGDSSQDMALKQLDQITINIELLPTENVSIAGEVNSPGTYPIRSGERLSSVIRKAGGCTPTAWVNGTLEVFRTKPDLTQELLYVDLESFLKGDASQDIPLQKMDRIVVSTEFRSTESITIKGEVKRPGTYPVRNGEKLSSVLQRAGGFTSEAYLKAAVFTREAVRQTEKEQMDRFVKEQQEAILHEASAIAAAGVTGTSAQLTGEAETQRQAVLQRQQYLTVLSRQVPLGRMTIRLQEPDKLENTPDDILLTDGDSLSVPKRPSSVLVIGSVHNQTAFLYKSNENYQYYLGLAGGPTRDADESGTYILKADGSAERSFLRMRKMEVGDTIVVPVSTAAKYRPIPLTRDFATIIGQFALTIGVLIALFP